MEEAARLPMHGALEGTPQAGFKGPPGERRLAAVMFTDIVGFAALT